MPSHRLAQGARVILALVVGAAIHLQMSFSAADLALFGAGTRSYGFPVPDYVVTTRLARGPLSDSAVIDHDAFLVLPFIFDCLITAAFLRAVLGLALLALTRLRRVSRSSAASNR